jgi:L,D-peptidoglycan transpeptidase YkuD (ErfK/YbiS/YcfS/YnhG family)
MVASLLLDGANKRNRPDTMRNRDARHKAPHDERSRAVNARDHCRDMAWNPKKQPRQAGAVFVAAATPQA